MPGLSEEDWTEEQRERARRNREKALALQAQKRKEREDAAAASAESKRAKTTNGKASTTTSNNIHNNDNDDNNNNNRNKNRSETKQKEEKQQQQQQPATAEDDDLPLEDFEIGASEFVTQTEAQKVYLLPMGTLRVCRYVEKENPRNRQFQPMKLYHRAEIRRRARDRWGGIPGLQRERTRRQDEQFERDLRKTKNIFGPK